MDRWAGWKQGSGVRPGAPPSDVVWHKRGERLRLLAMCGLIIPKREETMVLSWSFDPLYPQQKVPLGATCEACLAL